MNATCGTLHLIPVMLGDTAPRSTLSGAALEAAADLDYFIVENEKSARRFLREIRHPRPLRELQLARFDKDGDTALAMELLRPVVAGRDAGVLSEAGSPAVADPGALLVAAAHRLRIRVVPHVGPSAILLGLMASGFNGQRFAFHGYLPVPQAERRREISRCERESRAQDMTQIFIETPYRNDNLLQAFMQSCGAATRLCVASDLTLATASVCSATIAEWKSKGTTPGRRPSVFLLYAR